MAEGNDTEFGTRAPSGEFGWTKRASEQSDKDVREILGGRLRTLYLNMLEEPIPDEMLDLLRQLDEDQSSGNCGPNSHG